MISVNIDSASVAIDENWDEVIKNGNYLAVVFILSAYPDEKRDEAKTALFSYYLRASQINLPEDLLDFASMQIIEEVFPIFDYIFNSTFTVCPLPEIKHKGKKYKALDDKLENMTGHEMENASWAYSEYTATGDETLLNYLIAIIYRTDRNDLMPRIEHKKITEARAAELASLDSIIKQAVCLWYKMCEAWWAETYKPLYDGESGKADSLGVSRLVTALTGDIYGTIDKVRVMSRDEIYFGLSEMARRAAES